jgi:thymidylate kinase
LKNEYQTHPKIISFEGIDRSGKSSAIVYIENEFNKHNIPVSIVGSKSIGDLQVPKLVGKLPDEVVYMLYWQAIRLSEKKIEALIQEGNNILCYRGILSNLAYDWQNLDSSFKDDMDSLYLNRCLLPNILYLFHITYETFLKRDDGQTVITENRFHRISNAYYSYANRLEGMGIQIIHIDGNQPLDDMFKYIDEIFWIKTDTSKIKSEIS